MHLSTEEMIQITKKKVNRFAKTTMAGPGKFGVLIFICMMIVGIHETLQTRKNSNEDYKNSALVYNTKKIYNIFTNTMKENKEEKISMMNIIRKNQNTIEKSNNDYELEILFDVALEQKNKENMDELFM